MCTTSFLAVELWMCPPPIHTLFRALHTQPFPKARTPQKSTVTSNWPRLPLPLPPFPPSLGFGPRPRPRPQPLPRPLPFCTVSFFSRSEAKACDRSAAEDLQPLRHTHTHTYFKRCGAATCHLLIVVRLFLLTLPLLSLSFKFLILSSSFFLYDLRRASGACTSL